MTQRYQPDVSLAALLREIIEDAEDDAQPLPPPHTKESDHHDQP